MLPSILVCSTTCSPNLTNLQGKYQPHFDSNSAETTVYDCIFFVCCRPSLVSSGVCFHQWFHPQNFFSVKSPCSFPPATQKIENLCTALWFDSEIAVPCNQAWSLSHLFSSTALFFPWWNCSWCCGKLFSRYIYHFWVKSLQPKGLF